MGNCVTGPSQSRRQGQNTNQNGNLPIKKAQGGGNKMIKQVGSNSNQHKINNLMPIIKPILPKSLITSTSNPKLQDKVVVRKDQFFELKAPKDYKTWTEFEWIREPRYRIPKEIEEETCEFIKGRSFQEKHAWFRRNLEKLRIPWNSGKSDYLIVDRGNLLMSSHAQFEKIDFHKEVKIEFKDEKDTTDAGGLLREWISLCINETFSQELNMLSLCETVGTFYKFNFNEHVSELFEVAAKILGIVIGKAIFQRIPIRCFLNYSILRQICSQPIQMNDIFSYDQDFYRGWTFVIQNNIVTSLEQNFCVYEFDEHGTQITIPLKENGFHIMVNSTNRNEYIALLIKHYCTSSVLTLIENLRYGLYKVIPHDLLSVFEPQELDIIINGKKEIDIKDLKLHIKYTNFQKENQVISWFWEYMDSLTQEQLENVLHFVTGNSRVPILGFKYLESNRGEFMPFQIKKIPFNPKQPYPMSHTCFNRLELPEYPNKESFLLNIIYISVENKYFGLQ